MRIVNMYHSGKEPMRSMLRVPIGQWFNEKTETVTILFRRTGASLFIYPEAAAACFRNGSLRLNAHRHSSSSLRHYDVCEMKLSRQTEWRHDDWQTTTNNNTTTSRTTSPGVKLMMPRLPTTLSSRVSGCSGCSNWKRTAPWGFFPVRD